MSGLLPQTGVSADRPWSGGVSSARAWGSLGLLSLLYIISFIDRLILALLIEPVKADLGVTDVQIGLLIGTSFAVVYSIAGLPIARLADVGNRRMLILIGAAAWGASTTGAAFATSFSQLVLLRVGVALGEAALTPAAMSLISDMFPPSKKAAPLSLYVMVGVCGGSGAMIVGAAVLQLVAHIGADLPIIGGMSTWRLTLFMVGLPALALACFTPLVLPRLPRLRAAGQGTSIADVVAYYRANVPTYVGYYVVTACVSSVNFSILTWYPTHLIRTYGMAPTDAGYLFGIFGVVTSLIGGLLVPFAARRLAASGRYDGAMTIALVAAVVSTPLIILALLASTPALSIAIMVLPLIIQMGLGILLASTAPLLAPGAICGQVVAIYYLVLTLVGLGAGPPVVAAVSKAMFAGSISQSLAAMVFVFAPIEIAAILLTRRAFAATHRTAFERSTAGSVVAL